MQAIGPCVIGIIFRKLRSKYMGKHMVGFNAGNLNHIFRHKKSCYIQYVRIADNHIQHLKLMNIIFRKLFVRNYH